MNSARLQSVELAVAGNEASDLLPVHSEALLTAHGARRGFWTVLDEGPIEECLALLLERADDPGHWFAHHLSVLPGREAGRTEDGEALAYRDGWVYAIGSHFGSKGGPLRPRRAFFSRFREEDAARGPVPIHIVRNQFRLHRVLNDALRAHGIDTVPPGERSQARFIVETTDRGTARGKSWTHRLAPGDHPVNVEAAAFTPAGTLLIGLRFPVTTDGEPILLEIDGIEAMFDGDTRTWPHVVAAHVLTGVTPPGTLTGFRAITARPDGTFDAVIGSIDALNKGSILLDDHPHGGGVECRHVRFSLPDTVGTVVAELAPFRNVEGLAEIDGHPHYVTDEDHRIALWFR
ncbi:hypothetical protein [Catenuloplanes atrovinosus]|uniref:Uncharacterized protein n=1 Tax=Catenuloplanes atrovinosus TaxID=137266 RepID=A0AAE3YVE1_9ACTN|nr:hypothetical protein [Catenuloplanes atrovinosus]MDR7279220.1 hypothetical protein [Catenuloplanes atrovinosus]